MKDILKIGCGFVVGGVVGFFIKHLCVRKQEKQLKEVVDMFVSGEINNYGITPEDIVDAMYDENS